MTLFVRSKLMLVVSLCVSLCACAGSVIEESTGEFLDSSVITAKVKAKLVDDPVTSALNIKVATFKGVVQLSGFVDTENIKIRAMQIAMKTDGVKEVKNDIIVK